MAGKKKKKSTGFWGLVENFQGDKVIWMIVLLLIMVSILAISSSTPLLAIQRHSTRTAIMKEQLWTSGLGLIIIIICYNVRRIGIFRVLSQFGYIFSLVLLLFLALKIDAGPIKAARINGAVRAISIFGAQFHVFEFVKIAMIMYLSWAINAYHKDEFTIANALSEKEHFKWLKNPQWKLFFYVFFPILSVCVLLLAGSVSSALFIGMIMFATILVGGVRIKDLVIYIAAGAVLLFLCVGIYYGTDGKYFQRVGTATERISRASEDPVKQLLALDKSSPEFQKTLDIVRQPISAKVAVSEGGLIGKGPGGSTQRYVVPVMFEDYMFSFIVEEYGILGALFVIILYVSLLARGAMIVKSCNNEFAKTAIAGLIILITGQAIMHMFINVDLGPLTGQTLPMISHGKSSFLAFSVAFGIILSISRMAKTNMDKIAEQAAPLVENTDEISEDLRAVEEIDNL